MPSVNAFSVMKYITPDPAEGGNLRFTQGGFDTTPLMPRGLPLFKPPYSRITAIDLNAGDHAWMQPNGDGDRVRIARRDGRGRRSPQKGLGTSFPTSKGSLRFFFSLGIILN